MKKLLLATIISASFWCVDAMMTPADEIQFLKKRLAQQQSQITSLTEQNRQLTRRQGSSTASVIPRRTSSMTSFVAPTTSRLNRTTSVTNFVTPTTPSTQSDV